MGVSNAYQLHGVRLHNLGGDPIEMSISEQTINTGTTIIKDQTSASIFAETAYVNAAAPTATFATPHLDTALINIGPTGLCINAGTSPELGLEMWARDMGCDGPNFNGTDILYNIQRGILYPSQLAVDHQGNAQINMMAHAVSTPSGDPPDLPPTQALFETSGVTAPATFAINKRRWTIHSVLVNGAVISSVQSIQINFGNSPLVLGAESEIDPSFAANQSHEPQITLTGVDVDEWKTLVPYNTGLVLDETPPFTTIVYLKAREVARNVAAHVGISIAGRAWRDTSFSATGRDNSTISMTMEGVVGTDGSQPMVTAANIAIPDLTP